MPSRSRRIQLVRACTIVAVASVIALPAVADAHDGEIDPRFTDTPVLSTPGEPTVVQFAPDGRAFVAEKRGVVQLFDGLGDTTPEVIIDLQERVNSHWDRGLLGMALDPDFPAQPYLYLLYTVDAPAGVLPPVWGDDCPDPPGAVTDGCVVDAALSRFTLALPPVTRGGGEQVLLEGNWCQQAPGHTVGALAFATDGSLYVSAGDGAYSSLDYGQFGGSQPGTPTPANPCDDPPGGVLAPPSAEGGALRAQDLETSGDPVTFDGSLLRIDPATGAAHLTNPLVGGDVDDDDRVVAYGLRQPFRLTVRPGTNEAWIGEVGGVRWEEINRLIDPTQGPLNFGWPCYEGPEIQPFVVSTGFSICQSLYLSNTTEAPYYAYRHGQPPGADHCDAAAGASISGLAFYESGGYPSSYEGALFFADSTAGCIWAMMPDAQGLPDPNEIVTVVSDAASPVALTTGPDGDVFYVDHFGKHVRRLGYESGNRPPEPRIAADVTYGPAPLTVQLDASGTTDPDSDPPYAFAWDLDGDGEFDDSTATAPSVELAAGIFEIGLEASDDQGASARTTVEIHSGNTPPVVTIDAPTAETSWSVGETMVYAGHAVDTEDGGTMAAAALSWTLYIDHCPDACHRHTVGTEAGVAGGSFEAPQHEYPTALELTLTATDSGGLSASQTVRLEPRITTLRFESAPAGLELVAWPSSALSPFDQIVVVGSQVPVVAPTPQLLEGDRYVFQGWSDEGDAVHVVVAGESPMTLRATYGGPGSSIFADDLESGDLGRWDSNVGGPAATPPR